MDSHKPDRNPAPGTICTISTLLAAAVKEQAGRASLDPLPPGEPDERGRSKRRVRGAAAEPPQSDPYFLRMITCLEE